MNEGRARMLVGGIAVAAGELRGLVACKAPEFESFWAGVVGECLGLLASDALPIPSEVEDLAERIVGAFGVGMGSLSDLVLWREDPEERRRANAQLRALRCKLGDLGARLRDEARVGLVDMGRVRFYLTALEELLLRGNEEDAAGECRALLNADELDCGAASALAESMAGRAWRHPWTGTQAAYIVAAIRNELKVYIVSAGGGA